MQKQAILAVAAAGAERGRALGEVEAEVEEAAELALEGAGGLLDEEEAERRLSESRNSHVSCVRGPKSSTHTQSITECPCNL